MPHALAHRRNPTATRVCIRPDCGTIYHPFRGREETPGYCSRECSRAAGTFAAHGVWPEPKSLSTPPTPARTGAGSTTSLEAQLAAFHAACEEAACEDTAADQALSRDARTPGQGRTLVLAGQGAYLGVEHGALVVRQGRTHGAPIPREVLHPSLHDAARIVWLDGAGTLTVTALAWCQREGVSLTLLDTSGRLLAQTVPEVPTAAQLRRKQYLAAFTGQDVAIARAILTRKLQGQRTTLTRESALLGGEVSLSRAQEALDMALSWLRLPTPTPFLSTLDGLRAFEGRCARAYFDCLATLPLVWHPSDVKAGRVPDHWRTLGQRTSPLAPNGNGRNAIRPGHAILNLAYGALASDVRAALLAEGLDVACGFLHLDKPGRESLVWDMVELRRGEVEALVLAFLSASRLQVTRFERQPDGGLRLGSVRLAAQASQPVRHCRAIPGCRGCCRYGRRGAWRPGDRMG